MENGSHFRRPARTAAAICAHVRLKAESRQLLRDELSPRAFFDLLMDKEQFADAIRFLAHAMPKRAAVWWGCLCAWQVVRPSPPDVVAAALEAAVQWVLDPSEANRRAAKAPGRAATVRTPAGCLALAACWSGGSMSRPELPPVPPSPHLTARLVAGAVLLAAAQQGSARRLACRQFLAMGLEVAQGDNLWASAAEDVISEPEGSPVQDSGRPCGVRALEEAAV